MRRINLLGLELEGFRSFRAKTVIELSQGTGLKFLSGDNKAEPRLGANGAGKSSLWDALTYCLYGVSVKGIRASNLLSWGAKDISVTAAMAIDNEVALIERKGMPDRLFINDQPADQLAVDRLIGLSRGRFLQSAIFGQAVPLFIDLPGPERGALLDEVLDLGIWLKAAEQASKRHADLNKSMVAADKEIAFFQGKIEGMESLDAIEAAIQSWQAEQDKRIEGAIADVEKAEADLEIMKPKIVATKAAVDALPSLTELNKQLSIHQQAKAERESQYREMFRTLQTCQADIKFYETNKKCPTCKQPIDGHHHMNQIVALTKVKTDTERSIKGNGAQQSVVNKTLERLQGEQEVLARKRDFLIEQRTSAAEQYRAQERIVEGAVNAVERMMEAVNPHESRRDALVAEREEADQKLKSARSVKRRLQGEIIRADFWRAAFKRVRLFMVKRILAQLEIETASAAAALGLIGWTISFSTELETKSGSVRPGIHIMVASGQSSAPWEAWSGGEGQRIRLAVALGLASLIQRMAGVQLSFEVWDEPTNWLSEPGVEDLLETLKHRAETHHKSIWLCDMHALVFPGFAELWLAKKEAAGSRVYMLSNQEG